MGTKFSIIVLFLLIPQMGFTQQDPEDGCVYRRETTRIAGYLPSGEPIIQTTVIKHIRSVCRPIEGEWHSETIEQSSYDSSSFLPSAGLDQAGTFEELEDWEE